jgi:hypothetical protein
MDAPIGYLYGADAAHIYCPTCITIGWVDGTTAEQVLDNLAIMRRIDRTDETTYDSSEFPKALHPHMEIAAPCIICGNAL